MNVRTGLDVVGIARVQRLLDRRGSTFLDRIMRREEKAYCLGRRQPAVHVAGTVAAKEAVFKALGTAPRWQEVVVRRLETGEPVVALSGSLHRRARAAGVANLRVSISHAEGVAAAVAVALCY